MVLKITVYKGCGKYYTESIAHNNTEIPIIDDAFKDFVRDNIPAMYSGGYVVVTNADENSNHFYECLFKFDELFPIHMRKELF